jgi:hypothetical protein
MDLIAGLLSFCQSLLTDKVTLAQKLSEVQATMYQSLYDSQALLVVCFASLVCHRARCNLLLGNPSGPVSASESLAMFDKTFPIDEGELLFRQAAKVPSQKISLLCSAAHFAQASIVAHGFGEKLFSQVHTTLDPVPTLDDANVVLRSVVDSGLSMHCFKSVVSSGVDTCLASFMQQIMVAECKAVSQEQIKSMEVKAIFPLLFSGSIADVHTKCLKEYVYDRRANLKAEPMPHEVECEKIGKLLHLVSPAGFQWSLPSMNASGAASAVLTKDMGGSKLGYSREGFWEN